MLGAAYPFRTVTPTFSLEPINSNTVKERPSVERPLTVSNDLDVSLFAYFASSRTSAAAQAHAVPYRLSCARFSILHAVRQAPAAILCRSQRSEAAFLCFAAGVLGYQRTVSALLLPQG
jgi:hypothetical protein